MFKVLVLVITSLVLVGCISLDPKASLTTTDNISQSINDLEIQKHQNKLIFDENLQANINFTYLSSNPDIVTKVEVSSVQVPKNIYHLYIQQNQIINLKQEIQTKASSGTILTNHSFSLENNQINAILFNNSELIDKTHQEFSFLTQDTQKIVDHIYTNYLSEA